MKQAIDYLNEAEGRPYEAAELAKADKVSFSFYAMRDASIEWAEAQYRKNPTAYSGVCKDCGRLIPVDQLAIRFCDRVRCEICYDHIRGFDR